MKPGNIMDMKPADRVKALEVARWWTEQCKRDGEPEPENITHALLQMALGHRAAIERADAAMERAAQWERMQHEAEGGSEH